MPPATVHGPDVLARRDFSLRLAPAGMGRALRIAGRWRLPTLFAQVGTVPAFYLDMLRENVAWLAIGANLTAAWMLAAALWRTARVTEHMAAHLLVSPKERKKLAQPRTVTAHDQVVTG